MVHLYLKILYYQYSIKAKLLAAFPPPRKIKRVDRLVDSFYLALQSKNIEKTAPKGGNFTKSWFWCG